MSIEKVFGFFVSEVSETGEKREIRVLNRQGAPFKTAEAAADGANLLVKDWEERFEALDSKEDFCMNGKMYKNTVGVEKSFIWIAMPVLIQEFFIYQP